MYSLLNPRFWLITILLLGLYNVILHEVQVRLDPIKRLLVALDDFIQLSRLNYERNKKSDSALASNEKLLTFLIG